MSEPITGEPDIAKALEAAKNALTEEEFDFAAAVQGRGYPEFEVPVYLDETKVARLIEISKEQGALEIRISGSKNPPVELADKLEALIKEHDDIVDSLRAKRYVVKIKGISPEESDRLLKLAFEAYPQEFEEIKNGVSGVAVKREIESEDRDALYASLLRQAHLVSVTAPSGAVDKNWTDIEKVKKTIANLPFVARAKIDTAINESTIAVDFYQELADEVF